jgi:hypothetical protein
MPHYPLSDAELDAVVAYLKTLTTDPSPGVTDKEIHFATLVGDGVDPATRKAFLDVFAHFLAVKNTETRHEGHRAAHAPWNKKWIFEPYRKWVLHVWDLHGPPETWPAQLKKHYADEPVFAVLSGIAPGPWQPVHTFYEDNEIPCLFPVTDLPVIEDGDFYSVYFTRGMALEADAVARHLADDGLLSRPVTQVFRPEDPRSAAAAARFRRQVATLGGSVREAEIRDSAAPSPGFWSSVAADKDRGALVVWLGADDLARLWASAAPDAPARVYVSASLTEINATQVPSTLREELFVVVPHELPDRLPRLLARSTGWFKAKRIYAPDAQEVQGDVYFTLKMTLGALIRCAASSGATISWSVSSIWWIAPTTPPPTRASAWPPASASCRKLPTSRRWRTAAKAVSSRSRTGGCPNPPAQRLARAGWIIVKVARSALRIPPRPRGEAGVRETIMAAATYILRGGADAMAVRRKAWVREWPAGLDPIPAFPLPGER